MMNIDVQCYAFSLLRKKVIDNKAVINIVPPLSIYCVLAAIIVRAMFNRPTQKISKKAGIAKNIKGAFGIIVF
jgi:hypothetical protein